MSERETRRGRAPSSHGARTTLRVPPELERAVDRLAEDLHTSRNDALLRLAARGATLYEQERQIAARAEQRWAAVLEAEGVDDGGDFPPADEAYEAVMGARADLLGLSPE